MLTLFIIAVVGLVLLGTPSAETRAKMKLIEGIRERTYAQDKANVCIALQKKYPTATWEEIEAAYDSVVDKL
jgi:hypothetical protein